MGTSELAFDVEIELFPNPNNGTFFITGLPIGEICTIHDDLGKLVLSFKVLSKKEQIKLPELAAGNYHLKFLNNGILETKNLKVLGIE